LIRKEPYDRIINVKSLAGTTFHSFAKDNQFDKDLYHVLVARHLQTDLLTETWQKGKDIGVSCQGNFTVEDVNSIKISGLLGTPNVNFGFSSMKDHSKFAMGKHIERPYVCVGDINRQPSQYKRGGGALCFKDVVIWAQYYNFV
jgi:deoxyribonuclease-2